MKKVFAIILCLMLLVTSFFTITTESAQAASAPFDPNDIVDYALSQVGTSTESGMCMKWVADAFRDCYQTTRYSACCAAQFGIKYRDSSSRDDIPLGADVFFSGFYGSGNDTCSSCGNKFGNIGIYVGDGYIVHSWGGKVKKDKIDYLLSLSNSGKLTYYGWGWHGNMLFQTTPVTPVDTEAITAGSIYSLQNYASGKYLTVPTTYNSSSNDVGKGHVVLNAQSSASDQKVKFATGTDGAWILYPQSISSGRIIETYMADTSRSYVIAGDRIALFYLNDTTPHCGQFVVKWVAEGVCALLVRGDQTLAVAPQSATAANTNLSDLYLVKYTGESWQHWKIQNSTGGWVLGDHTHSYGGWLHNGSNHWKQCSCGETTQMAAHTWNSGVVTTQPTESEPGVRTYTCTICPRTKTESIPATGYTLTVVSANSTMGTVSGGGTYQAGATATIKAIPNSGYEFVSWNDGNTSATRTITVNSSATYIASFQAVHTHSYGDWLSDANNHWKQCSCGEKTQKAAHTWNSGVVTTQPTESEPGVRTYTCTICPRTKTESIPATGYTLTVVSANSTMGTVSGGGTYQAGATATIKAIPNSGYEFVSWNDGNTNATRTITVNSNATYTASFKAQAAIEDAAKFTVANVTAQPGGYADVTVSVADNPGIASFVIGLKFDSSLLTPVSITPNSALISGITSNLNSGSTITDTVTAVYSDANGFNDDGVLYTIRFKVADTADSCTTPINLAIDEDGITGNGLIPTVLPFQSYQGSIKITSFLYGDCNLDGKINGLDSVLLARYLAKWSMELTSTQLLAMDVNADGKINGLDSVLLARYLAKWDVKLGPQ